MQNITITLQILLAKFNGQILIPLVRASESIGIPGQTARNQLTDGTFPIPTVKRDSRRFIHISDLADYVESLRANKPVISESTQPKKGRPPKLGRLKAQGRV